VPATITRLLWVAAWLATSSCHGRDDGDESGDLFEQLLASYRRTAEMICACTPGACREGDEDFRSCVETVWRRHEPEFADKVPCALDIALDLERCLVGAGCDDDARAICYRPLDDGDDDGVCGGLPQATEMQIQAEAMRECPFDFACADGTTARGFPCDGIPNCGDGSDEGPSCADP
jgi:hypothetical protein